MALIDNSELMITILEYIHPAEDWKHLGVGLLGGLEISYHCSLLRSRPVSLEIQTERLDFYYLSRVLQIPYYGMSCAVEAKNWEEITRLAESFSDVFLCTEDSVFAVEGEFFRNISQTDSKPIHQSVWTYSECMSVYAVEGLREISQREMLFLCLAEQSAYFQNATGVERNVQNWINHVRRKSLRKSWPSILRKKKHYYWMAQQLYTEILRKGDTAGREKYIAFLRDLAEQIELPELAQIAVGFRRSIQSWSVLAMVLLDASIAGIAEVSSAADREEDLRLFLSDDTELDIDFRLEVIENALNDILRTERDTFVQIGALLQRVQLEKVYEEMNA